MLILAQIVALAVMGLTCGAAIRRRDIGWVDVGWTAGLGVVALLYAVLSPGPLWRRLLIGGMAAVWAFRLGAYILQRVLSGGEDARYRSLREHWGQKADRNTLILFAAESLLITLFSVPLLVAMGNPQVALTAWDVVGIFIWVVAVGGEAIADRQLQRFRDRPENRSRTCRDGLWRYSRHPNYFFEWVHWFAYAVMAMGAPYGAWAWLGPVLMFLFLFKLTGIPFAEKQSLARRGDDYRRYQETTSIFIPWFPRKEHP